MVIISKKKLYVTRFVMWGGLVVAAVGIIVSFVSSSSTMASIVLLAAGLCVSLLGAFCLRRMFRCPNCKKSMLPDDSGIDFRNTQCPKRCPNCGLEIQMKE